MACSRTTKKRSGVRPQANLPYLPPELLTHIVHSASDPSTVLTMHLLSRRYSVECHLAIDTVLSRQPMAAYLCAYSSYHRLLLLGRAGRCGRRLVTGSCVIRETSGNPNPNQVVRGLGRVFLYLSIYLSRPTTTSRWPTTSR